MHCWIYQGQPLKLEFILTGLTCTDLVDHLHSFMLPLFLSGDGLFQQHSSDIYILHWPLCMLDLNPTYGTCCRPHYHSSSQTQQTQLCYGLPWNMSGLIMTPTLIDFIPCHMPLFRQRKELHLIRFLSLIFIYFFIVLLFTQ